MTKFDHSEITDQEAQDLLLGGYVCVPTLTKSESLSEAQNLISDRSERQTETNSTFCSPSSLEKKHKPNNVIKMSSANKNKIAQSSGENESYFHHTAIGVKRHYSQSC